MRPVFSSNNNNITAAYYHNRLLVTKQSHVAARFRLREGLKDLNKSSFFRNVYILP